jgi:PAS domain S-box-containing protein
MIVPMPAGEEMFGKLVQLTTDGIIIADSGLRIIAWNRATERILGLSPQELEGKHLQELLPEGARQGTEKRLVERLAGGAPGKGATFDAKFRRKDGTEVHVEHTVTSWVSSGSRYFGAIMRDITEWENAKMAVALSEAKYRGLVDNAAFGIVTVDTAGRLTYVNDALCRICGYPHEELLGKPFCNFLHPEDTGRFNEMFQKALTEPGGRSSLEFRILRKDDSIAHCYSSHTVTRAGRGTGSLNAVIQDITELKNAQEALKESEEMFRNLAEQSPNMIFINIRGKVVYANRRCEEIMGFSREEFYSPAFDFMSIAAPEYRPLVKEKFKVHMSGRDVFPYEYAIVTKDGKMLEAIMSPKLINYCGETAILGTITDITERKTAERAIHDSERFLDSMFTSIQDGVSVLDRDMRILRVNPTMEKWYAHAFPLVGKKCFEAYHGRSEPCEVCPTIKTLETDTFQVEVVPKRGRRWEISGWLELYSYPLRDTMTGQTRGVIEYVRDITERRLAEDAVRASEERYRSLFETSPDGVVLLDPQGGILELNAAAERLLGQPRQSAAGKDFTELGALYEEDRSLFLRLLQRVAMGETQPPLEMRVRAQRGDLWQEVYLASIEKEGKVESIQVIFRDITDRKAAQKEMLSRLMVYDLEEGNLYMVRESSPLLSLEGFRDLMRAGYRGAVLSRNPPTAFKEERHRLFEFRWLSERHSAESISPDLDQIERWLEGLPRSTAVLIDRMDYLVFKNGVPRARQFVHTARDLAHLMGHVIILSVDPAAVGLQVLAHFQKEAREIVPRSRPHIPEDLLGVLKHVYQQNAIGLRPTFTQIREALGLSKPTTSKRVNNLVRAGHLALVSRGRTKAVELTEKGRRVFPQ